MSAPRPGAAIVLDIDVIGEEVVGPDGPTVVELQELCALALSCVEIEDGHMAIEFVDSARIRDLNRRFRAVDAPTDVLSFGVDQNGVSVGPRELGDIVICPEHTEDLREAVVHGSLHLCGMDHETDEGEMLVLQAELMRWVG